MDEIEQIVERAIACTVTVLQTAPEHLGAACAGLERLRNNLLLGVPNHPALDRLGLFLVELELRASPGPIH
ncbi:MAG: hypothetical protein WAL59_05985 [Roseiarcus sp.]